MSLLLWIACTRFQLLTSPSFAKMHILSILFLATRRDPRKFPVSTAVAVLAFPSSYLKVPIFTGKVRKQLVHELSCASLNLGWFPYDRCDRFRKSYDSCRNDPNDRWTPFYAAILEMIWKPALTMRAGILSCSLVMLPWVLACIIARWNTLRAGNTTPEDWKRSFSFTVRPSVRTNPSRKRSFSEAHFKLEEFENAGFSFLCEQQKTFWKRSFSTTMTSR